LLAVAILAGVSVFFAALTPSLPNHASLKAASVPQFLRALAAILGWPISSAAIPGWPISSDVFAATIVNLPALVFLGVMLWKRPPVSSRNWFLVALVVWTLGQAASVAYGRAACDLAPRYLDLFAIGILANFVCLLSIAQGPSGKRDGWKITAVTAWAGTVLISLSLYAGRHLPADLSVKRDTGFVQETNTRAFVATGDFKHLKDKPLFHVPYWDPVWLAATLESPEIRAILPTNIRAPLEPLSVTISPAGAFVPDGYSPTTPKRYGMTLGSYVAQGDATKGEAWMQFDGNRQSAVLAIPVAGYPLRSGITLQVEQNGRRSPVVIKGNPEESWGTAYAKVGKGAFSIHLSDASATTWVAVGGPCLTGRLDALTNSLLAHYRVFLTLGLVAIMSLLAQCGLTSRLPAP
jgi:hypothetical protein